MYYEVILNCTFQESIFHDEWCKKNIQPYSWEIIKSAYRSPNGKYLTAPSYIFLFDYVEDAILFRLSIDE